MIPDSRQRTPSVVDHLPSSAELSRAPYAGARPHPLAALAALAGLACLACLACLLLLGLACAPEPAGPAAEGGPYNLVIVLSDSLRASNLPFYGYDRETAPRLSALLGESVLFADHLADYPGTPISVSQMQSGRLMPPLLMDHSFALAPVKAIEEDLLVLPRVLRAAGYRTGIVTSHPWFNRRARILRFFDGGAVVPPREGQAYARFEDLIGPAEQFVAGAEEPFFLYVHAMDTHSPFGPPAEFREVWPRDERPQVYDLYDGEILYTDYWVGRLIDSFRDRGLLERTVFVFTSDHGEEFGERGPGQWNWSHGYTARRPQLHVPLLVRLPGGRVGGTVIDRRTRHIDLAPTLLGLVGSAAGLDGLRFDGRDLSGTIGDPSAEPRPASDEPPAEGEAGPEELPTIAYTWRYWALHQGDLELEWDQWRDQATLGRVVRGPFNYEASEPVDDPGLAGRLRRELLETRKRRLREQRKIPPSHELLASIPIGVPTTVVEAPGGAPTFEQDHRDGLWFQDAVRLLTASPGEEPGPLTLATPWAPGTYRVRVRLAPGGREAGYLNRFRLRIGGGGADPLELDGSTLPEGETLLDAGVYAIGPELVVEISEPRGGVAISGFLLELEGATGELPETGETDAELERRLRALGYVQ